MRRCGVRHADPVIQITRSRVETSQGRLVYRAIAACTWMPSPGLGVMQFFCSDTKGRWQSRKPCSRLCPSCP